MNDLLNFFESLVFEDDREALMADVVIAKRNLYLVKSADTLNVVLRQNFEEKRAQEFFSYLTQHKRSITDGHIIEEIFDALLKRLDELDVMSISIPLELSRAELVDIHKRLCNKLGTHFLLKTILKPKLIGGVQFEYKGIFVDRSLATTIKKLVPQIYT